MRRWLLIGGMAIVAAAIGVGWWSFRAPSHIPEVQPNVLLVTIDTLRADRMELYGGPVSTPNMEQLADDGRLFTFAHAHNVVTLPSHVNILTGTYPFEHGVRENSGFVLGDEPATLAEMLGKRGYSTSAFIAAAPLDARFGLDRGFDVYDDSYPSLSAGRSASDFVLPERRAEEVVKLAVDWIDGQPTDEPWLTWVHLFDPHAPYSPPSEYRARFPNRPYDGEIAYTDDALGTLFDRTRDGSRPTLTIVTSDHGEALGDHGEMTHGLFAYESTLAVPLIVHLPGYVSPAVVDRSVGHIDIAPTILEAVGISPPADWPGHSLLATPPKSRTIYFEALSAMLNRGWAPLRGVIDRRLKAIDLPLPELYDLAGDSAEQNNLVDERRSEFAALDRQLKDLAGDLSIEAASETDPELMRQLQALGYTGSSSELREEYGPDDDPKRLVHLDTAYHRGIEQYQNGDTDAAITTYEEILEERPDMLNAATNLAFLYAQSGQLSRAITTLQDAIERTDPSPSTVALLGNYLTEAGRAAEAAQLLAPLSAADHPDTDALTALGRAYASSGRHDEALETFQRILEIDPGNAATLQNIGTVYLQQGNLQQARANLRAALDEDPSLARALNGLGVIAVSTGDPSKAVEYWTRAVDIDPTQYDTLFNLGVLLDRMNRPTAAAQYWREFLENAPRDQYEEDLQRARQRLGG